MSSSAEATLNTPEVQQASAGAESKAQGYLTSDLLTRVVREWEQCCGRLKRIVDELNEQDRRARVGVKTRPPSDDRTKVFAPELPPPSTPSPLLDIPRIRQAYEAKSTAPIFSSLHEARYVSLTEIFEHYVRVHIAEALEKLRKESMWSDAFEANFEENVFNFCEELAAAVFYAEYGARESERYFRIDMTHPYYTRVFDADIATEVGLRKWFTIQAAPLRSTSSTTCEFIHRSLWEYFLARHNTVGAARSCEASSTTELVATCTKRLCFACFTQQRNLLCMHAELLAHQPQVIQAYVQVVLASRVRLPTPHEDQKHLVAASNAVSILNFGSVSQFFAFKFSDVRNWSKIRIPFANLNYAQFLHCNLDYADLSNATMYQTVLFGSSLREATLKNVQTRMTAVLYGPTNILTCVAYSPDGSMIAVGGNDDKVRIWSTLKGKWTKTISDHSFNVLNLAFSPNGKFLATVGGDRQIILYSMPSCTRIETLAPFEGVSYEHFTCVCFKPDSLVVAAGGSSGTIMLLSVEPFKVIKSVKSAWSKISGVGFSPNGRFIGVSTENGPFDIYDANTLDVVVKYNYGSGYYTQALTFSPEGTRVALASGPRVDIWDMTTETISVACQGHQGFVKLLRFSPNGNYLAACSSDKTIYVWNATSGELIETIKGHTMYTNALDWSPDGRYLASVSHDQSLRLWRILGFECSPWPEGHGGRISDVALSPDGKYIASALEGPELRIWDRATGRCELVIVEESAIHALDFSPDSKSVVVGLNNQTLHTWDIESRRRTGVFSGQTHWIADVSYSPSGKFLASCAADKKCRIWDVETHQNVKSLSLKDADAEAMRALAWSPDETFVAVVMRSNGIGVWNVETEELVTSFDVPTAHDSVAYSKNDWVAFSPDGKYLAATSYEKIHVWHVGRWKSYCTLKASERTIECFAWSPDSQFIASGGFDSTVRVFHVASGKCVAALRYAEDPTTSLAWSRDGSFLVTGNHDSSVCVWRVDAKVEEASGAPDVTLKLDAILSGDYGNNFMNIHLEHALVDEAFKGLAAEKSKSKEDGCTIA